MTLARSRLRTLPYLPASQRPDVIISKAGEAVPVDKIKVEGKERVLKRGQVCLTSGQDLAHG